ncbi:MAG: hypothetical protein AAF628_15735 [Planctomycetota bacterium]
MRHVCALSLVCLATVAAPSRAQVRPYHALVTSALSGPDRTGLFDADLVTGLIRPIDGVWPSRHLAPLAVRVTPAGDAVWLALDDQGSTRLVRLDLQGARVIAETLLGTLDGQLVADFVVLGSDVIAVVGGAAGGVVRFPTVAGGGAPAQVADLPFATAITAARFAGGVDVVQSPPPLSLEEPRLARVDLDSGAIAQSIELTGLGGASATGVQNVPTAVLRHLITLDNGRLVEVVFYQTFVVHDVTPAGLAADPVSIGPDAFGFEPVVLGGAAAPVLRSLDFFAGPPFTTRILAGPLPGAPVDFQVTDPALAEVQAFGAGCGGASPMRIGSQGGRPFPGNAAFAIDVVDGAPAQPIVLALGASDLTFGVLPLPLALPGGGCPLLVAPDVQLATIADANGAADVPVPVPLLRSLRGGVFYAQWLQPSSRSLATSDGLDWSIGL